MNLCALGLTTVEAIDAWAAQQPKLEASISAGSVVVFDGYVLHRGSPIRRASASINGSTRDVLYWGCESTHIPYFLPVALSCAHPPYASACYT